MFNLAFPLLLFSFHVYDGLMIIVEQLFRERNLNIARRVKFKQWIFNDEFLI